MQSLWNLAFPSFQAAPANSTVVVLQLHFEDMLPANSSTFERMTVCVQAEFKV